MSVGIVSLADVTTVREREPDNAAKGTAESKLALVRRARRVNRLLAETYPDARAELDFTTPLELLIATVLSAQTTDVRVNQTTPELFVMYPDAQAYAEADPDELEEIQIGRASCRERG